MMYLVCLDDMGCPPGTHRKLVSSVEAALNIIANSTGWTTYEISECEVLRERGVLEKDRLGTDISTFMQNLHESEIIPRTKNALYIYGEYTRPGIPWRSDVGFFCEDLDYLNKCMDQYLTEDYLYLAIIKIGNMLCNWTQREVEAMK